MNDRVLTVAAIHPVCPDVREFVFAPGPGEPPLAPYAPGSHVAVHTARGANAYSLTDDGVRPDAYRISVRRLGHGGGSDWLHDTVRVGDRVTVSAPRAAFAPVLSATRHLLIAAGIGVTPILSHLRAAHRWGHSFQVIYASTAGRAPHRDRVAELAGSRGTLVEGRGDLMQETLTALSRQPVGAHAYACGPTGFLEWFVETGLTLGWPEERLHVEYFQTPELDAGAPFTVTLASSGRKLHVPSGVSLLHTLDDAGVHLPRLCKRGVCGQCRVEVLAGAPEHRDHILTRAERERNDCMFSCVSRALGPAYELELDL